MAVEGRLIRIRRDYGGGNVQVAYEYGYGFDGGRRWRKDYVSGVWTRYPCGVACGAGELVEQQKPLDGGQWAMSALYLRGISLVRRNDEWHHFDPFGTTGVITNGTASVISRNLYDLFGVLRYEQGSAQTPWRWRTWRWGEEDLLSIECAGRIFLPSRMLVTYSPYPLGNIPAECRTPNPSGQVVNCEECNSVLYNDCLRSGKGLAYCYTVVRLCQTICTVRNDPNVGIAVWLCWQLGGRQPQPPRRPRL